MITLSKKEDCCGCNACGDVCAADAISFIRDGEGFLYPNVDTRKCSQCGLCDAVCPVLNVDEIQKHNQGEKPCLDVAVSRDLRIRFESTSGGVFSILADHIFKEGGFVAGAIWDNDWYVHQIVTDNPNDLPRLRCSKYAQSDARGFFVAIKTAVLTGRRVLACGTPCQMAALRLFLGKEFQNLFIIDFICKAVPSPLAMVKYVQGVEKRAGARVVSIQQKNKEFGWRNLTTKFVFDNGHFEYDKRTNSPFMNAFIGKGLLNRHSCYSCRFRGFPRIADLTVGDAWGIVNQLDKKMDGDLGTSLVFCNTEKGRNFWKEVRAQSDLDVVSFDVDHGVKFITAENPGIKNSPQRPDPDMRCRFFEFLDKVTFHEAYNVLFLKSRCGLLKRWLRPSWRFIRLCCRLRWKFLQVIRINGLSRIVGEGNLFIPFGNVVFDRRKGAELVCDGVVLYGKGRIEHSSVESRVLMNEGSRLIMHGGCLTYGADFELFKNAELEIGADFYANINCSITCGEHIKIGSHVWLGRNVSIRDTNSHVIGREGFKITNPVEIGDHVWIGSGALIMPGVKIGSGAVVGANSLVLKDVPPQSLVVGSPARVVRSGIQFKM